MPKPPSPTELGLPEKFGEWRPLQYSAVKDGIESDKRFVGQSIPTGGGKSLTYIAQAHLSGGRTAIVTATKGLQEQIMKDFGGHLRIANIMGKSNYQCSAKPGWTCQDGYTGRCPYKGSVNCSHSAALFKVLTSPIVVTNYTCWISAHKYGTGLGPFDRLILDEAHSAFEELSSAVQIQLSDHEIDKMCEAEWPNDKDSLTGWKVWASAMRLVADQKSKELKAKIDSNKDIRQVWVKDYNHLRNLVRKFGTLATIRPQDWLVDTWEYGWKFDSIQPRRYAENMLYLKIPHVGLFSATIKSDMLPSIGIFSDYDFWEYPSTFDPSRNPIYHVPTVTMNKNVSEQDLYIWLMRADQIIQKRLDRKGIFHTVSFPRQQRVIRGSEWARFMLNNLKGEVTSDKVAQFERARAPSVLVSPSVGTGYDFIGDKCRFQILGKVPWPDISTKLMIARTQLDPQHGARIAAQQLMQMCGRGRREDADWCENMVIDDGVVKFLQRYRHLTAEWFMDSYQPISCIPEPPEI